MDQIKERTKDIELNENLTFDDLMLSETVLNGLKSAGYMKPSPIQLKAIPLGKLGLDLIVQAKSGTGKTLVFSIISLENIILESKALQVLILAPTREVALQITGVIKNININRKKVKVYSFIGGHSINEDKIKLKLCHIAVGTPGRISHLIKEKLLNTDSIRLFVLDEADKLLSSEFQEDINFIYSNLPDNKQMVVLSATYPSYMATYVTRYMRSATFVRLNIVDPSLRGIKQYYKLIPFNELKNINFESKINELIKLFSSIKFTQCIVFTNYQLRAENLCQKLSEQGWPAIFIAGNIEQNKRTKAIMQLKEFKCRILVSTDLTARGIDAENVDLIVCMDVPSDAETYLHRIGRAGRYGCHGIAVSFVCEHEELKQFENIVNTYKLRIKQYGRNLDDIIKSHNHIAENQLIDDFKIERVHVGDEELVQSLKEYEKAKEQQLKLYKVENKRPRVAPPTRDASKEEFCFNLFNSIESIESSLAHSSENESHQFECNNLKKYKKSIENLDNLINEQSNLFRSKFENCKIRFKNKVKAKMNKEELDEEEEEKEERASLVMKSETETETENSETEEEEEEEEEDAETEESKESYLNKTKKSKELHKLLKYNYYYNYYYLYYYNYFLNSNK